MPAMVERSASVIQTDAKTGRRHSDWSYTSTKTFESNGSQQRPILQLLQRDG